MTRPNIVLIMTDTQATNVVGCYGHPELLTPNIDRLAQTGVKFERAYTTCPVCTPARAALFSGLYAHTAGPWTNNLPLGANIRTMGQRFQDGGYHSVYVGKWHLDGHDYFGTGECPPGWDENYWYDGRRYLDELSADEIALWRTGLNSLDDLRRHNITAEFTWAHRVSERALRFLAARDPAQPFLLVVSYDEPHHPFTCPPQYAERFADYDYPLGPAGFDTLAAKPQHQREWAASERQRAITGTARHPLYFGCNSFVDAEIGRVIDAVHARSAENTLLVFTSDHGEMLTAHQMTGKGAAMYEEITRVPLIIEQPDQAGAGTTRSTLVSHIDLLPTLLDLAGLERPPILEGRSFAPVLAGTEDDERAAVIEFNRYEIEHDSFGGYQPIRCIVGGPYKLVINLMTGDELYHLGDDPAEIDNLIDDARHAEARDALHDRLLDWMDERRDPFRGYYWERRPWRSARRRAWRGAFRPRPADGYAPSVLDYDTGLPISEVKPRAQRNE